jgi:hypothetical protein
MSYRLGFLDGLEASCGRLIDATDRGAYWSGHAAGMRERLR